MCIRDRRYVVVGELERQTYQLDERKFEENLIKVFDSTTVCLLYTSDAADERSSVDLGGRRIIKKKTQYRHIRQTLIIITTTHVNIRYYLHTN